MPASFDLPIINPLESYASFTYVLTISCLTSQAVNSPDSSYKLGELGEIILRSAGGMPDKRVSTAFTSSYNPEGKFDFFIDDLSISGLMTYNSATGGTNATNIKFVVTEPYSMGLFLQACQIGARNAGHGNYLEAPFLLTIEFIGHDGYGREYVEPMGTRHIPFKFSNIGMTVNGSGCNYTVEAFPWTEIAFRNSYNLLKSDYAIAGATVQEILQTGRNSLQYWLNESLKEIARTATPQQVPDEIVIMFPKELTSANQSGLPSSDSATPATVNPNSFGSLSALTSVLNIARSDHNLFAQSSGSVSELGLSRMAFDATQGGVQRAPEDREVRPNPRRPVIRTSAAYDPTKREFRFQQNTTIVNAITEIMVMSDYCKQSIASSSTTTGMKKWFRIESQVFNLGQSAGNLGAGYPARLIVYKVVPFLVHEMRGSAPAARPRGYAQLRAECAKYYNYIYTGKNTDIIDFKIELKSGFFTTAYADAGQFSGAMNPGNRGSVTSDEAAPTNNVNPGSQEQGLGQPSLGRQGERWRSGGGSGADSYATLIAKQFQEALLNSPVDMLTAELEILGDPYYIADSGLGNFSNTGTTRQTNVTESGAIDYQSGEVDILITFRTPIDYNSFTGEIDFGNTTIVKAFTGLYQVTEIESFFKQGKFNQRLQLIRRRNQDPEPSVSIDPWAGFGAEGEFGGITTTTLPPLVPGVGRTLDDILGIPSGFTEPSVNQQFERLRSDAAQITDELGATTASAINSARTAIGGITSNGFTDGMSVPSELGSVLPGAFPLDTINITELYANVQGSLEGLLSNADALSSLNASSLASLAASTNLSQLSNLASLDPGVLNQLTSLQSQAGSLLSGLSTSNLVNQLNSAASSLPSAANVSDTLASVQTAANSAISNITNRIGPV